VTPNTGAIGGNLSIVRYIVLTTVNLRVRLESLASPVPMIWWGQNISKWVTWPRPRQFAGGLSSQGWYLLRKVSK